MIEVLMFVAIAMFIIAFAILALISDIALTIVFAVLAAIFGRR